MPVEMIGSDVQDDADFGMKLHRAFQLKTADFQNHVILGPIFDKGDKRDTDVAPDAHILAAEPHGRAAAIHCRVAAANDDDALADFFGVLERDGGEPVDTDMDIPGGFLPARDIQILAARRAGSDKHRIEVFIENSLEARHLMAKTGFHTHVEDDAYFFIDHLLRQPEGRDIGAHKPTAALVLLEQDASVAQGHEIARDREAGLVPCFVCATVGTTSSQAIDPVPEIGRLCREQGLWLHVDAAMVGTAALCPEFRYLHDGLERADSYCFSAHKWMFTNFDCTCFYVADRKILIDTLSILPEYLRNQASASGAVIDYRDWHVPLGRRFRALKLWFVIRHYGVEGLRHHVRQHVAWAGQFASWVEEDPRFERAAPVPLNLVCFRHRGGDAFNQQMMERLNRSGDLYLTHTLLDDRFTLRLCVGQAHTEARHVKQAWQRIVEMAQTLEQE